MNHLFVTLTFIAVLCRSSRQYDQLQYSQTFGPYYPYGVRGYYSNNNYLWPSFATLQPRFYYYHYPRSSVTTAAGTTEPVAETAGTTMTPGTRTTKPVAGTAGTMTTPGTTTTSAETPKPVAGTAGTTAKATRRNLATDSSTTGLTPAKDSINVLPADPLQEPGSMALIAKSLAFQQPMTYAYNPLFHMVPDHMLLQPSPSPAKKTKSDPNGKIYKGRITRKSSLSHRSTSV